MLPWIQSFTGTQSEAKKMNIYYYNPKDNAFYPLALKDSYENTGTWPDEGIEVDEETYLKFSYPPEGKMCAPGDDGYPVLVDTPPPTREELIAAAEAKKAALLATVAPAIAVWQTKLLMGRKLTTGEATSLSAWLDYSDAMESVDPLAAPDIDWPEQPQ